MRSLGEGDLAPTGKYFLNLTHPYWNFHYTLTSKPAAAEMALVGETRIAEILANVVLPFRGLQGRVVWPDYARLPARLTNRRLETGAARLFGDDPRRPRFLRTVAQQQGLLQIYEDFCLQDALRLRGLPLSRTDAEMGLRENSKSEIRSSRNS